MLMEQSALPRKVKMASLAQMVIKRCTNQVGRSSKGLKTKHLSKLMFKMKKSGYSKEQRLEVLVSGLRGYERMVRDQQEGRRPINRTGWMGQRKRRLQKLVGKGTWFKKKG